MKIGKDNPIDITINNLSEVALVSIEKYLGKNMIPFAITDKENMPIAEIVSHR